MSKKELEANNRIKKLRMKLKELTGEKTVTGELLLGLIYLYRIIFMVKKTIIQKSIPMDIHMLFDRQEKQAF